MLFNFIHSFKRMKLSGKMITFLISTAIFVGLLIWLPEGIPWSAKATISIMIYGILLWAFESLPLGMTSVFMMILLLFLHAVPIDVVLSGFGSPAVFLIVAGMMIAKGVNETPLMNRITYMLFAKWGSSAKGIFIGVFLLMQLQAFFIPATAVRSSLIVPVVLSVLQSVGAKKGSNFSKLMLVGTAYAGNISGTAILTAAIGNILTIEILQLYVGKSLSYLDWFVYAFPVWILLIVVIPYIVWKCFPPEDFSFHILHKQMKQKKEDLGGLSNSELKCMIILSITVLLWMTQPIHGYHPTVPALMAVVLMALPRIGFVKWKKIVSVNFDLVLLIGATLSLGFALIDSGAIELLEELITSENLINIFANPWLAILMVILISQIYHLGVTNVSTAVVTLLPVLISLSLQAGIDPVVVSFTSAITILFGYLLIVETMPNVVVHGTGMINQRDFYLPGLLSTLASTLITLFVAFTWWRWLGFWP
ncbi:SLC13 family permease [Oceanobacillus kimchii]|uniref:SLC13 family permease n=1 Tax=Oceanobacillus kimchii TaxID=746691 RepID=UPI0021A95183|nr:SLC13 family permease [Oceanobacillus kimchii]MCT1578351.1 SLC13 family permease [Oceanobacillus kimchii]MCT2134529.1 SLC13 family permease [Oceanobacillus kimchii]